MTVVVTPHLNFRGTAREALAFYQSVFGGETVVATHAQAYPEVGEGEADLVAFGQVTAENGFSVMVFDVPAARAFDRGQESFFVAVDGPDGDELAGLFAGLAEGATVVTPFGPAAWSPGYGMLVDRFGVTWVVSVKSGWAG